MTERTVDAALAAVTLGAAVLAFVLTGASPSPPAVLAGALGTVAFELLAAPSRDRIRRHWERRAVQLLALVVALGLLVLGAWVAPSRILSAAVGALASYLLVLGLVSAGMLEVPGTS